ncbi:PTS ascorbate transporter subunit IIC [[Clostridium] innocuum]|nr:PTS ascorbate transporter subunit IIC [[Clostridium] innocuum]MCR0443845.1 PTS ascorbate transporter subunit IIC [[Clostridium] innocuum]
MLNTIIDIAKTPAILVALIAILGQFLQKKSFSEIMRAGIKTFVGFLVISAGADVVSNALAPFGDLFQKAFNVAGVVPTNEAIVAVALKTYGTETALIMLVGMGVNILLARFTRFKYIYLTGHCTFFLSACIAAIISVMGFKGAELIVVGGLIIGIANTVFPAMTQPFTRQITGDDSVALAHTGDSGYALSALVGMLVGNKEKSTENIKFPQGLTILRDSTISITLTMAVIYIVLVLLVGSDYIATISDGTNGIVWAITKGGSFAGGVFVVLSGVRLVLAEIVPAFQGISEKLVPDAKPALDCPIVFPYAPNAVLIGFLSSFVGGVVSFIIMMVTGTTLIVPGVIPHFFCGATAGVYGNATGGLRGCVIGSFIQGVAISYLPLFILPMLGGLGFEGSTFGDADYGVVSVILGGLNSIGGKVVVIAGIVLIIALLFALTFLGKKKRKEA